MKNFIQSRNFWENTKLHLTLFLFFLALLSINTVANAQCSLKAEDSVNVYVNENCEADLDYTALLTDDGMACSNNANDYIVFLYDENYTEIDHGTGSVAIPSGNVGKTLYGKVEYNPTGNQTGFIPLHIFDHIAPTIDCPTDTMEIACWQSDSTLVSFQDNCSAAHLVWTDESITENDCSTGTGGLNWPYKRFKQIKRSYVAVDSSGNQSTPCEVVLNVNSYDYWNNAFMSDSLSAYIWGVPNFQKSLGNAISCENADSYKDADGNFDPNKTGWPDMIHWDENPSPAEIAANDVWDTIAINNNCQFDCHLASTYIDVKVNTCPQCIEKVVRTWTVVESNCDPNNFNSAVFFDVQFIEVVDTTPPAIVCPQSEIVNTNQFNCFDTYTFPVPVVTDNCQTEWEWDILVQNNSNYPQIFINNAVAGVSNIRDLPVDTNHVTYTITDKCGNKSECTYDVIVQDKVEPVAVCQTFTTVALTYDGEAQLPAYAVNSGSYDNCSVVSLQIKRMETNDAFADYVTYTCADMNPATPWMVILQVEDAAGNKGQCMVSVEVQDKLPPTITCPDNQTVECDYIYEPDNLTKYFGWPTAHDNCNFTITTDSSTVENACYDNPVKVITRNFTATDDGGRTDACTQTINFVHDSYFGYGRHSTTTGDARGAITWPSDTTITDCIDPNTANDPTSQLHPNQSGRPILNEHACDQVGVTYSDFLAIDNDNDLDNNEDCFKIIRTWTVIDDCHKVGGSFAKWNYDQVIYVKNNVDPVIDNIHDKTVCTYDSTCVGGEIELKYGFSDDCTQPEDLRWRYFVDYNNDNAVGIWDYLSPIHSGDTLDASGTYDIGTHKIMYQVWDQCGNSAVSEQLITIQNCKKPTPICIDGLTVDLTQMLNGPAAVVMDTMFDGGSYHTCGYDLVLSFSADTSNHNTWYGCNELGSQPVELWVTALLPDGSVTQDFCTTSIEVQDNNNLCNNPIVHGIVSGAITNFKEEPVENVELQLQGSELGNVSTDAEGKFEFAPVELHKSYKVVPEPNSDYLNGLSTLDLVYIQKHILGIKDLKSPYAMIASDVNNDKKISASDILALRKLILGVDNQFADSEAWKFVPKDYQFENPNNPVAENYASSYDISDLANDMDVNFVAIKIGDASGDAIVNSNGIESRNTAEISFVVENTEISSNEEIEIPVLAKDFSGINGFQTTIAFNPGMVQFENVESGVLNINNSNIATNKLTQGYIPVSWFNANAVDVEDNAVLFTLKFKSLNTAMVSEVLSINSDITKTEAYDSELNKLNIALEYRNNDVSFELLQNRPNPFANTTQIAFNIPENTDYSLNIFDVTGKLVYKVSGQAEKGFNTVEINKAQLNATGVLYYTLSAGQYTATKKMVVIK